MRTDQEQGRTARHPTRQFFTTRSRCWRDAGLARQLSRRAVKRARIQSLVLLPVLVVPASPAGRGPAASARGGADATTLPAEGAGERPREPAAGERPRRQS